jgi:hypothetical protein
MRSAATMESAMVTSVWRSSWQQAGERHGEKTRGHAHEPVAGCLRRLPADVGAQEVQRPVRQVHLPHETEDERETASHHEVQGGQAQPIQERQDEQAHARATVPN